MKRQHQDVFVRAKPKEGRAQQRAPSEIEGPAPGEPTLDAGGEPPGDAPPRDGEDES